MDTRSIFTFFLITISTPMFAQNLNPLSNKLLADFKKAFKEDTIKNSEYAQLRVGDIITLPFLATCKT